MNSGSKILIAYNNVKETGKYGENEEIKVNKCKVCQFSHADK